MCKENNEITNAIELQPHKWTQEEIETIRNTVAEGANESELKMFLSLASAHGLNPFQHEIWFVKNQEKNKNLIMTARDGYLKIALNNPHFQGMEADAVYSGDKFVKDKDGIHHSYNVANRGNIIGAYAVVYRDDRKIPSYFFAPFSNYNRRAPAWNQYPHAMIIKVAESMALKRAFAINGLVTQEEMGYQGENPIEPEQPALPSNPQSKYGQKERSIQVNQLWSRYLHVCDNQANHAKNAMKKVTGKESSKDFTDEDITALFEDVVRREDELTAIQAKEREQEEAAQAAQIESSEQPPETIDAKITDSQELGFID